MLSELFSSKGISLLIHTITTTNKTDDDVCEFIDTFPELCEPNFIDSHNRTALIYSIKNNFSKASIKLLENFGEKCIIYHCDNDNKNSIDYAFETQMEVVVLYLKDIILKRIGNINNFLFMVMNANMISLCMKIIDEYGDEINMNRVIDKKTFFGHAVEKNHEQLAIKIFLIIASKMEIKSMNVITLDNIIIKRMHNLCKTIIDTVGAKVIINSYHDKKKLLKLCVDNICIHFFEIVNDNLILEYFDNIIDEDEKLCILDMAIGTKNCELVIKIYDHWKRFYNHKPIYLGEEKSSLLLHLLLFEFDNVIGLESTKLMIDEIVIDENIEKITLNVLEKYGQECDLNYQNICKYHPLSTSIAIGSEKISHKIIEIHNCDDKILPYDDGDTILLVAFRKNMPSVCVALVKKWGLKLEIDKKNPSGKTIIDLACDNNCIELLDEIAKLYVNKIFVDILCCVCLINKPKITIGCGHTNLCSGCFLKIASNGKKTISCPTCRKKTSNFLIKDIIE